VPTSNGAVFVLDLNDSTVKEYSLQGRLLHRYSPTGDETPGRIVDFAVGTDGTVWTDDPNGEVAGIRSDGSVPYQLEGLHAMRLAWLRDRLVVQTVPSPELPFGDRLFVTVNPQGRVLGKFGELVEDTARYGISVIGQPVGTSTGALVYAPFPVGLVAKYDFDGHEEYVVKTIRSLPLPTLQITKQGATHLPPVPSDATQDVSVWGTNIFVLSGPNPNDRRDSGAAIVDVYSLANGQYRYSFPLPFDSTSFAVSKDLLYASHRNVVYVWMLPKGM